MKRILTFITIMLLMISGSFGQTPEKKRYKAAKISVAPVINGILDDESWLAGDWIDDFTQNRAI